jgi:2,4-dienoyl-CoA reductase-like NADH-dependent reductase (Old Yellow Enzyme family)
LITIGGSKRKPQKEATFTYLARDLGKRNIAFLYVREYLGEDSIGPKLKKAFDGVYIANEKFTKESAKATIAAGNADAVAFGQLFLATPDYPTFYASGAKGYTNYHFTKSNSL